MGKGRCVALLIIVVLYFILTKYTLEAGYRQIIHTSISVTILFFQVSDLCSKLKTSLYKN